MKAILLQAPDSQLDPAVLAVIRKWSEPETAANVLEALDCAVYGGEASDFALNILETLLQLAIKKQNTTYEEVVKSATWRAAAPYV